MSRAKEWVENCHAREEAARAARSSKPEPFAISNKVAGEVRDDGDLILSIGGRRARERTLLSGEEAIALARWIIETWSDAP